MQQRANNAGAFSVTSYDQQFYTHLVVFVYNQMLPFPTIHPSMLMFNNERIDMDRQSEIEENNAMHTQHQRARLHPL